MSYADIRESLTLEDCLEIIEAGFEVGLDQAVNDWIDSNFSVHEFDVD